MGGKAIHRKRPRASSGPHEHTQTTQTTQTPPSHLFLGPPRDWIPYWRMISLRMQLGPDPRSRNSALGYLFWPLVCRADWERVLFNCPRELQCSTAQYSEVQHITAARALRMGHTPSHNIHVGLFGGVQGNLAGCVGS